MDHKRIVIAQYKEKADRLRAELAEIETVIKALGGSTVTPSRKRTRKAKARTAAVKDTGGDSPVLVARLKAISARTDLTPIQKAQESRKARAALKRGGTGAVLSEAAAAG